MTETFKYSKKKSNHSLSNRKKGKKTKKGSKKTPAQAQTTAEAEKKGEAERKKNGKEKTGMRGAETARKRNKEDREQVEE